MQINNTSRGVLYGLAAYAIWGFFPLYFNLLGTVAPTQVLAHRVIWSCLLVALLLTLLGRWPAVRQAVVQPRLWLWLGASALLISCNWLVFIWAVGQHRVLASSLGYFLTPLVSVVLAMLFLKERLSPVKWLAVGLAVAGIGWQVVALGTLPWVSLTLATSFGLYGLVRKQAPVDTLTGLMLETLILLPFALGYWAWLEVSDRSQFVGLGSATTLLLVLSGLVTALPLLAFAAAAKRLSLTAVGFMMYLNPTLQFLTAVLLFGEPFGGAQMAAFLLIWMALAVFSLGALRGHRGRLQEA